MEQPCNGPTVLMDPRKNHSRATILHCVRTFDFTDIGTPEKDGQCVEWEALEEDFLILDYPFEYIPTGLPPRAETGGSLYHGLTRLGFGSEPK